MKAKLTLIAAAMAISGLAFAQGADTGAAGGSSTGTDTTQGAAGGDATGGGMTSGASSFTQLDKNGDGKIDYTEAQSDPTLAKYWQDHNLSQDHAMDQSEFSQFESSAGQMQSPESGTMQRSPSDMGTTPSQSPSTGTPSQ